METKRHRHPIYWKLVAALLSLLHLTPRCAIAQSSSPSDSDNDSSLNNYNNYGKFNPTVAVVIVVIISAFFFLGYFCIYARNCAGDRDSSESFRRRAGGGAGRSRRQQGLSPEVIETFPTMVYAEVKELKADKGALECAVCLSEFEDDEELRLLPHCSHVFHSECIGAWLDSHVTCPVCRANLAEKVAATTSDLGPPPDSAGASQDHVSIVVDMPATCPEEEAIELARIGSQRRAARSRSGRRPVKLPRSHSTGHSVIRPMEGVDRYTLRLPENVRKEILAARNLHRSASCVAIASTGEGSSRRGPHGGGEEDSSSRRWRSFRFRKSERWPSFFFRTLSVKIPTWAAGKRVEGVDEGSVKKVGGDDSTRGQQAAMKEPAGPAAVPAPSLARQV